MNPIQFTVLMKSHVFIIQIKADYRWRMLCSVFGNAFTCNLFITAGILFLVVFLSVLFDSKIDRVDRAEIHTPLYI